jgi:hypothetical protein
MHTPPVGRRLIELVLALGMIIPAADAAAAAPTHAEFVAKENALCLTENAQGKALESPTTAAQAVVYLTKTIAIVSHLRAATLALPAPASDRPLIVAAMSDLAKEIADLRQARTDAKRNNATAYSASLSKATVANKAGAVYAKKLGLGKACTG